MPTLAEVAGVLPATGPIALRKLHRRQLAVAGPACGSPFTTSMPTAAGRTIWPTKPPAAPRACELLDWWQAQLDDCYAAWPTIRCSSRSAPTIREFAIPIEPFRDLLAAFRQDQTRTRYETFDDLLGYCRNSANPVGRLVLYLGRCHDEQRGDCPIRFAPDCNWRTSGKMWPATMTVGESICRKKAAGAGYDEAMFARHEFNPAVSDGLMRSEVDRAEAYLRTGEPLVWMVPGNSRVDVRLFIDGGLAILEAIRGSTTTCGERARSCPNGPSCGCWSASGEEARP